MKAECGSPPFGLGDTAGFRHLVGEVVSRTIATEPHNFVTFVIFCEKYPVNERA
jgi:hypothetical protein